MKNFALAKLGFLDSLPLLKNVLVHRWFNNITTAQNMNNFTIFFSRTYFWHFYTTRNMGEEECSEANLKRVAIFFCLETLKSQIRNCWRTFVECTITHLLMLTTKKSAWKKREKNIAAMLLHLRSLSLSLSLSLYWI